MRFRRYAAWGLLTALLLLTALFLPHRFVRDTDSIAINWVVYGGYGGDKIALTPEQTEALQGLICSAYVIRTYGCYGPYRAEPLVEISFRADGQPGHLELGEADFMYHSAGVWHFFNILQGEQFQREALSILGK